MFRNGSARCTSCRVNNWTKCRSSRRRHHRLRETKETQTGDTFCDKQSPIVYDKSSIRKRRSRLRSNRSHGRTRRRSAWPCTRFSKKIRRLHFTRDAQTKEFLLSGSGQLHVETVVEKLKKRYGVEVTLHPPKVPYKETITQRAEVQGRSRNRRAAVDSLAIASACSSRCRAAVVLFSKTRSSAARCRNSFVRRSRKESSKGAVRRHCRLSARRFQVQLIDGSYHIRSIRTSTRSARPVARLSVRRWRK